MMMMTSIVMIPRMRVRQARRTRGQVAMMPRRKVGRIRGAWIGRPMRRISQCPRRRSCGHAGSHVLAIGTTAVPSTIRRVLEAFAIFFEAKRFATLASILVDPRRVGRILRASIVWLRSSGHSRRRRGGWRRRTLYPARGRSRIGKARRRHGWIPHGELFVKSRWVSFQNGFPSSFNGICMRRVVVAVLALAARATRGGRSKALTIQLETAIVHREQRVRRTSYRCSWQGVTLKDIP